MSGRLTIIGAGVIGCSVAVEAARRGWQVQLLERHGQQRDGCSFGNAGMFVPSHFVPLAAPGMIRLGLKWLLRSDSPFHIRPRLSLDLARWGWWFWRASQPGRVAAAEPVLRDLLWRSRELLLSELGTELDDRLHLQQAGLIMLCKLQKTLEHEAVLAERAVELGVPAEVLDAAQLQRLDPAVDMNVAGGVFFSADCFLNPARYLARLQADMERLGVEMLWGAEVQRLETDRSRIRAIHTDAGSFEPDEVVLCGGSWSSRLVAPLGLTLPMQAGKGYSLTLDRPRQLPTRSSILVEARVAVTPIGEQLRFAGTMQIDGLNLSIAQRRVDGLIGSISDYLPAFRASDFSGQKPWVGLRPVSPDGLPYLGRCQQWNNLTLATGHAMLGLSLAPITGRLVGQLLDREPPEIDLRLLQPDRYAASR